MDNYEVLLAGGKEGEGFEAGNAEDSNIIFRIELPPEQGQAGATRSSGLVPAGQDAGQPVRRIRNHGIDPSVVERMNRLFRGEVSGQRYRQRLAQVQGQEGNHFMVTTRLLRDPEPWWRPGMTGLAKLDVGQRNVAWILFDRLFDTLRLYFWW